MILKDRDPFSNVMGVDVSKAKLDFAFGDDQHTRSIENNEKQIVKELIGRICPWFAATLPRR